MPMPDGTYWVAKIGDQPVGGLFPIDAARNSTACRKAGCPISRSMTSMRGSRRRKAAGAKLMRPIFDVPGVGRIAILTEPGGAGIGWMTPVKSLIEENAMQHTVVSQDEWLTARKALLAKEKEFTKARDALSAARRELPWVKIDKNYVFDGPAGKQSLADLFDGRSQLIVYHFMLGPGWKAGCPQLLVLGPTISTAPIVHLAPARRDAGGDLARAARRRSKPTSKRMGWKFKWVSSFGNDFNLDFHVSFTPEERRAARSSYNLRRRTEFPSDEARGRQRLHQGCDGGDLSHLFGLRARPRHLVGADYNYPRSRAERPRRRRPRTMSG